jgi:glycerophosphoryl diester phosphodiesterase
MASSAWNTSAAGGPLVIAHRGGAALAAENSAAAFAAAAMAGADAVETDVRVSADGTFVCLHDADLQRLCGDPRRVAELNLDTLRGLIPGLLTLDAAIATSAPLGILLDVKLMDSAHLSAIIRAVETGGAIDRAMLGLRSLPLIEAAREISSDIAILALLEEADLAADAADFGANWFRFWQGAASEENFAAAHENGLRVAVMVGQPRNVPLPEYPKCPVGLVDAEGLRRLRRLSPDAIMLDDPRLLKG